MSQSGPISSNGGGGGGGDVTSVAGTLHQIDVAPTTGAVVVGLSSGISLGSFELIPPPIGGMIVPGQVGIGTSSVDPSSLLQVQSVTKGFLPPVMTDVQKLAIASPAPGLVVYDNTNNELEYWNASAWVGIAGNIAFTADTGTPFEALDVTIYANNAALNSGSSVLFNATNPNITLDVTDSNDNTIIGRSSGVVSTTAVDCTSIGSGNFTAIRAPASFDVAAGSGALASLTTGSKNIGIGASSLASVTNQGGNVAIGHGTGQFLTGASNTLIGTIAGSNYVSTESSNIMLVHVGVVSENNTMRIGTTGSSTAQVNRTFIAGVVGASHPLTNNLVGTWNTVTEQVTLVPDGTVGEVLTTDGAGEISWAPAPTSVGAINIQKFTASGTYTPTANMVYCIVECVGGGGGGGGCLAGANAATGGGGGGGGEYARGVFTSTDIGVSQVVNVGIGGAGGAAGTNPGRAGSITTLGALITANGASGGTGATNNGAYSTGGNGGIGGTGGDFHTNGAPGGSGGGFWSTFGNSSAGGLGGSTFFGGGAQSGACPSNGTDALASGGGGSGGCVNSGGGSRSGGDGASGVMIITEYLA